MKQNKTSLQANNQITIFRYKQKDMEDKLYASHDAIIKDTAIPLGKDLAGLNKPEADCKTEQIYCGVISGAYNKLMMQSKTELQADIESQHIILDKAESKRTLTDLNKQLTETENKLRLKQRDLDTCDNSLLKKEKRYKKMQFFLVFMILIDMLISSVALEAMGYSRLVSYLIGFGIGIGIYFISERIPELIDKGHTVFHKRIIAVTVFVLLCIVFYVLGIFRSISFSDGNGIFSTGAKPIYFMFLNMFFVLVTTCVCYFSRLTKKERTALDTWKITQEEAETLQQRVTELKSQINEVHQTQLNSELSRKQLLLYAKDIEMLIQQLYEEAFKTFMSTNLIHRSDQLVPEFFGYDIPKLPTFTNTISL